MMEPGLLVFVTLVAFLALGLAYFRLAEIARDVWPRLLYWYYGEVGPSSDYVTHDDEPAPAMAVFPRGKAETEKAEIAEIGPPPAVELDIAALRHEHRAAALGALLALGLVKDGRRTDAMRAVFGPVTGEAYSRAAAAVRAHEQRVVADQEPRETPLAGRELAPGVQFVGETD